MRCGPHVMAAMPPGTPVRAQYERWIQAVRPPVAKFCRQGFDPAVMDWTRGLGTKVVGRLVEGDIGNPGGILNELLQFAPHLDYVEIANEESQGRDDPAQWDHLMGKCLDFMVDLDARNRAAGRRGPKACIANVSVGQPELERWDRPSTLEVARYAGANGHAWGIHEYYRSVPWTWVEGGQVAWDGAPPAFGWLMLRCMWAVTRMRANGVTGFRFIVTESGRDAVSGTPGDGGGWRDAPGDPYAEYMAQYGRHLSAIPECIGWVDFGFNAWTGWKQFDLSEDDSMLTRFIGAQLKLPGTTGTGGGMDQTTAAAIRASADKAQVLRMNAGAAIQRQATLTGYVIVGNEAEVTANGVTYVAQKAEHPTTGAARYFYAVKGAWDRVMYLGGA